MSGKDVIMIILENVCVEVTSRWYINSVVKKKKTIWVCRPPAICRDVFVTIGSLGGAKKISQCRVSRSTTVTVQREGKRRMVACMEAASCS